MVRAESLADQLSKNFDSLFATQAVYEALDNRISMTLLKKKALLLVLKHPLPPLENNSAENLSMRSGQPDPVNREVSNKDSCWLTKVFCAPL